MISSSVAFIIYAALMAGAFVYDSYVETDALAFMTQFTLGFIAYVTKRLIQKRKGFLDESQ